MIPDDHWADLANTVPGGFGGFYYDSGHNLILLLTDTSKADAAKQALAGEPGVFAQLATVRPARWNFAQLVDWFNYLTPRLGVPALADKDELRNRVYYNVASVEVRDRLVANLSGLSLPCDLIVVDATFGGVVLTSARP